jgi:hypothetical protein
MRQGDFPPGGEGRPIASGRAAENGAELVASTRLNGIVQDASRSPSFEHGPCGTLEMIITVVISSDLWYNAGCTGDYALQMKGGDEVQNAASGNRAFLMHSARFCTAALFILLIAGAAEAADCSKEGDPAFYVDFGEEMRELRAGVTYCWTVAPGNFAFVSGTCTELDTICLHVESQQGWMLLGNPTLDECWVQHPGYVWWQDICLTVPCEAGVGDRDTLIMHVTYCDDTLACRTDCTDCEDPNWYAGNPYYSADTVIVVIVPSPPALYIEQDSVYYVEQGQTAAYIPFTLCNGDPCADPTVYECIFTCTGDICGGFPQSDTTSAIPGGDCEDVYAIVNAGTAPVHAKDTMTIVAWDLATGSVYDTCAMIVEVLEPI